MFSKIPTDFNPKSTYINYPVIPQCGSGIKKKTQGTAAIDAPLHVNTAGSAQLKGNAAAGGIRSLGGEKGNQ